MHSMLEENLVWWIFILIFGQMKLIHAAKKWYTAGSLMWWILGGIVDQ